MLIRTAITFVAIGLLSSSCQSQNELEITDPMVKLAKETSLYADKVDWESVNQKYMELSEGKTTPAELRPALEYLLNSMGDKHGAFRNPNDGSIIAYYTGPAESTDSRDPSFVREVMNDVNARFSYELLGGDVGYLKVVGIGPGDIQEQTDDIRDGIKDLRSKNVKKWIVDLRYNGGGNMNPMIAGLAPLIGEGFIGGSADAQGENFQEFTIENGDFFDTGRQVAEMGPDPIIDSKEKVAVLLSRYTISSGELTAVAFKGRENTMFIGEATAGYTTVTGWDTVAEDMMMLISRAVYMDRNSHLYPITVDVDLEIEFVPTEDRSEDAQILKAIDWLE